jgi:hypothetical protein
VRSNPYQRQPAFCILHLAQVSWCFGYDDLKGRPDVPLLQVSGQSGAIPPPEYRMDVDAGLAIGAGGDVAD